MRSTAHWDTYAQHCPECEGYLEPDRATVDDPDVTHVVCSECETPFRLVAIPRERTNTHVCPDCDGDLEMAEIHYSRCVDCGAEWEIRAAEAAWLVPHEPE